MKKKIAAIVAVALIIGGAATAFFFLFRKRPASGALGQVPRNAIAVLEVDFAAAKADSSATQAMTDWVAKQSMSNPALGTQMAVFEKLKAECGLDFKSFSTATAAMLPPAGDRNNPQGLVILNGNFSADKATKCLNAIATTFGENFAAGSDVEGHKTLYPGNAPSIPREPGRDYRIVVMDNRVVFASVATLPEVFKVLDGKSDSAAKNDALREARSVLGNTPSFDLLFDLTAFSQTYPREWRNLTREFTRTPELSGFLPLLASVQTVSIGLRQDGAGLHFALVTRHTDSKQADETTKVVQGIWMLGKAAAGTAIQQVESRMTAEAATEPTLATELPSISAGFSVVTTLMNRMTIKNDGKSMRIELDVSSPEMNQLVKLFQNMATMMQMKMRPRAVPISPTPPTIAPPTVVQPVG